MLRGLSTGSKVRLGVIGVGLVGLFGYALSQGRQPGYDEADFDGLEKRRGAFDDDAGDPFDDDYAEDRIDHGAELEQFAAEQAAQKRTDQARREARDAMLGDRARTGPAIADTWLGPIPQLRVGDQAMAERALAPLEPQVALDLYLGTLRVDMGAPLTREEVEVAWGEPDRGGDTWIDRDSHACATLTATAMTWRRCQSLDDAIGADAPAAFAFEDGALGARAEELVARLGEDRVTQTEAQLRWRAPGLIEGGAPIEITASLDRARVVTKLEVLISADDADPVHARLREALGGRATWTGRGRTVSVGEPMSGAVPITITRKR